MWIPKENCAIISISDPGSEPVILNVNKFVKGVLRLSFHDLDKIPDYIKSKGGNVIFHIANDKEYWLKLKEKLHEEVSEFLKAESIEEMADILEVIDAIINYKSFSRKELENIKNKKAKERGKFQDKIILDES